MRRLRDDGVWDIGEVYTKEEAREMRLEGNFTLFFDGKSTDEMLMWRNM